MRTISKTLTILAAVALFAMPFAALAPSDDSDAAALVEAYDFNTLKTALEGDLRVCVEVAADFSITSDISVRYDDEIMINEGMTLTIAEGANVTNHGLIWISGTLAVEGKLINDMSQHIPAKVTCFGTLNGSCGLLFGDTSVDQNHTATYNLERDTGVDYEKVTLECKTSDSAAGEYTYSKTPGEGKYTITIASGTEYDYYIEDAGKLRVWNMGSIGDQRSDDGPKESAAVPLASVVIVAAALIIGSVAVRRK